MSTIRWIDVPFRYYRQECVLINICILDLILPFPPTERHSRSEVLALAVHGPYYRVMGNWKDRLMQEWEQRFKCTNKYVCMLPGVNDMQPFLGDFGYFYKTLHRGELAPPRRF